jgi:hypothetical protein
MSMNDPKSPDEEQETPDQAHPDADNADELADPEFFEWRAGLPSFVIDDERFYLPTGDIPMDEVQVAEYWRRLKASKPRDPESSD